jgi:hypothetical protein
MTTEQQINEQEEFLKEMILISSRPTADGHGHNPFQGNAFCKFLPFEKKYFLGVCGCNLLLWRRLISSSQTYSYMVSCAGGIMLMSF